MHFWIERGILKQYTGQDAEVILPEGITEIGYRAFYGQEALERVVLPRGLVKIGMQAFAGCRNLASVTVPDSVRIIGHQAFQDTLWMASQPQGVVYVGRLAYCYKGDVRALTRAEIVPGTVKLCADLFRNATALTQVTLPDSLRELDDRAFQNCRKLASITIPRGVVRIGDRAFDECGRLNATIACDDVTIGRQCFMDTATVRLLRLHPAKLPVNVRESAIRAFADAYCDAEVQEDAFVQAMCTYLQNRYRQYAQVGLTHWPVLQVLLQEGLLPMDAIDPLLDAVLAQGEADHAAALMRYKQSLQAETETDVFADAWDDLTLDWDVPCEEKTAAQLARQWGTKKNADGTYTIMRYYGTDLHVVVPAQLGDQQITAIGPYALSPMRYGIKHENSVRLAQIRSVTVSEGILRIGNHAFAGCVHLATLALPESVETIERDAFLDCPLADMAE